MNRRWRFGLTSVAGLLAASGVMLLGSLWALPAGSVVTKGQLQPFSAELASVEYHPNTRHQPYSELHLRDQVSLFYSGPCMGQVVSMAGEPNHDALTALIAPDHSVWQIQLGQHLIVPYEARVAAMRGQNLAKFGLVASLPLLAIAAYSFKLPLAVASRANLFLGSLVAGCTCLLAALALWTWPYGSCGG